MRLGFIGVCETLQNARDARALLEQALDAARFRRNAHFQMLRREIRHVHEVRREVVSALLGRNAVGVVESRIEARLFAAAGHMSSLYWENGMSSTLFSHAFDW